MQFNSEHCLGHLEACGKLMTLTSGTVAGTHHVFIYIHFINQACSPGFEMMPRVLISPPSTGLIKFALWTVGFAKHIGIAGVTLARTGGMLVFLAQENPKQWDWSYQEAADHRALGGPTAAPGSSVLSLPICNPFFEAGAWSRSHILFQASLAFGEVAASAPCSFPAKGILCSRWCLKKLHHYVDMSSVNLKQIRVAPACPLEPRAASTSSPCGWIQWDRRFCR